MDSKRHRRLDKIVQGELDTIEDYRTQIRRKWQVDLTIWNIFHVKTASLRSASD